MNGKSFQGLQHYEQMSLRRFGELIEVHNAEVERETAEIKRMESGY